ncbi:MAG: mechanosensitive ion channel family protein [Oleiphilaceae bacterium]|nr:mechanosensitive ion channel family protein [Oleiphilaceae bacterium]
MDEEQPEALLVGSQWVDPEYLDQLLRSWGLESTEMRGLLLIASFVVLTAVVAFIVNYLLKRIEHRCRASDNLWDDVFIHALRRPMHAFVWLQGVFWAAEVAYLFSEAEIFTANADLLRFGFIILLAWVLLGFVRGTEQLLVSDRVPEPMDYTTATAIGKLMRAIIFITAGLVMMQNMGYSLSGVLAFGGIGGIAIGFAAKDMLANFFGGAIIYLDQPFKVGDWIRSPDATVEGTVENIGWRVTRIRTFDLRPLYVPNAVFTTIAVENPSRMFNRRIFETVGVRYSDIHRVADIVRDIRQMLFDHDGIENERTTIVNFNVFNASSLDIMIYTFTKTRAWVEFHEVKQDVLLKVSQIIQEHGAEVAFPTRTLHMASGQEVPESFLRGDTSVDEKALKGASQKGVVQSQEPLNPEQESQERQS